MLLKLASVSLVVLSFVTLDVSANNNQTSEDNVYEKILSRKRRYVAFPEGSSFTVAVCTTIGVIGNPNVNYLSYALNWGVAYDLPNETWVLKHKHGFGNRLSDVDEDLKKVKIKRLFRRDLYQRVEIAIDRMGYDGKECILKALCESNRRFEKGHSTMLEEMLRTIFRFPSLHSFLTPHRDDQDYDKALQLGKNGDCKLLYPNCHFSVLDLALGKYSQPPNGYFH